ncbi:SDR family NAD(P)-dependent oxidoreductase [Nocardia arthritidis]|uniref:SDR family NAD(P)-dependent oxidoreductase n=1 Tax=Nocardia arthritidis TaxID=228602 RepID=UPI0007A528F2|nr:SDR family NAD(P)-dependent oxidoreductase [Nocardia arthritidis]
MDLRNKTAVVIGGGAGIGKAGVLALARAGCDVVVADIDEAAAEAVASEVELLGRRSLAVACDTTRREDLADLHRRTSEKMGQADIVWSHAGTSVAGPLEQIPLDRWEHVLDVNAIGVVRTFLEFGPEMLARGDGHIIITASSLGLFPEQVPIGGAYTLSKSGLIGLARTLNAYLRPQGVGVTLLCPDITNTRHTLEVPLVGIPTEVFEAELDVDAMQSPDEVADAMLAGLRDDTFMVSLTPGVRQRLHDDIDRMFGSGPVPGDEVIVQSGRLVIDEELHDRARAVIAELVAKSVHDAGNISFAVSADLSERGVFHIYEEWASKSALDRHAESEHGRAFVKQLPSLGVRKLSLRIHRVVSSQDVALPA